MHALNHGRHADRPRFPNGIDEDDHEPSDSAQCQVFNDATRLEKDNPQLKKNPQSGRMASHATRRGIPRKG